MSVHDAAEASQKYTCPVVTGVAPASTVAVSDTTVPEVTIVTLPPLDVIANAVVVADTACAETDANIAKKKIAGKIAEFQIRSELVCGIAVLPSK
jgi:hypothetical protein